MTELGRRALGGVRSRARLGASVCALLLAGACRSTPPSGERVAEASHATADAAPTSSVYLGRELAPPMSYLGADWLERPERDREEQPEHMLDVLQIREGDTVADVGAGSGYYTERLARRVGARGRVLDTDIQPEMIALIERRIREKGLRNVETILATPSDARLPPAAIDLVLMVDVYHELPEPLATLQQIARALRPGGRLALVEFRGEDPSVPIKTEHKMTLPQIEKELAAGGFTIERVDESLPWQRVVIAAPARGAPQ
ncbi:MAG: class I SAM-dependent methyltransferase [Polyangiaceae bacterium]